MLELKLPCNIFLTVIMEVTQTHTYSFVVITAVFTLWTLAAVLSTNVITAFTQHAAGNSDDSGSDEAISPLNGNERAHAHTHTTLVTKCWVLILAVSATTGTFMPQISFIYFFFCYVKVTVALENISCFHHLFLNPFHIESLFP